MTLSYINGWWKITTAHSTMKWKSKDGPEEFHKIAQSEFNVRKKLLENDLRFRIK